LEVSFLKPISTSMKPIAMTLFQTKVLWNLTNSNKQLTVSVEHHFYIGWAGSQWQTIKLLGEWLGKNSPILTLKIDLSESHRLYQAVSTWSTVIPIRLIRWIQPRRIHHLSRAIRTTIKPPKPLFCPRISSQIRISIVPQLVFRVRNTRTIDSLETTQKAKVLAIPSQ
jgi:hypothetical protein